MVLLCPRTPNGGGAGGRDQRDAHTVYILFCCKESEILSRSHIGRAAWTHFTTDLTYLHAHTL
jgi:hypothetical protein